MKDRVSNNNAFEITNYQAVNCKGKELGIVDGLVVLDNRKGTFVQLSTHHKDLFGDIKYAVPFDLCDIDHENKTIWLNVEKNELDFLYKIIDVYDKKLSIWDADAEVYFNYETSRSSHNSNQNKCI